MLGWTPTTYDAHNTLLNLVQTRNKETHAGEFNLGGYSNPAIDALIGKVLVETDQEKRTDLVHAALKMVKEDFAYIPLHQQAVVWAAKSTIDLVQPADNYFPLRYVNVK
jgi:peptide/nickel transport system substrate-binding protein